MRLIINIELWANALINYELDYIEHPLYSAAVLKIKHVGLNVYWLRAYFAQCCATKRKKENCEEHMCE